MTRVLLFGGTAEGRILASRLADAGVQVTASVASQAGADALPGSLPGLSVHVGAMSLEEKVSAMQAADFVVDATHPFATNISRDLASAARIAGKEVIRTERERGDVEGCVVAQDLGEAISLVPSEGNVLSTTGSRQISLYTVLPGYKERLYARVLDDSASIDACLDAGLPQSHIIARRGPFSKQDNVETIVECGIKTLVTKESGNVGGYPEKLAAARECGVRVIVVSRPSAPEGVGVDEAYARIMQGGMR